MSSPRVSAAVLEQIEQHVKSVTDREVGGVLVGTIGNGSVDETEVVAAIPALKAVGASANVTFTHEVWDEALQIVDRDHPGHKIVGWYHSHPDFGVFLSEYDLFIQQNFFPLPGMLALVVDPVRGEAGWFSTVGDEVVQTSSYTVDPVVPSASAEAQRVATRSRSYTTLLYGAAAVLVAFVLGWIASPKDTGVDDAAIAAAEQRAAGAEARVLDLEGDLARAEAASDGDTDGTSEGTPPTTTTTTIAPTTTAPTTTTPSDPTGPDDGSAGSGFEIIYPVQPNDSLWGVAQRFYGDGNRWTEIAEENDIDSGNIDPGDELVIPRSGGGPGAFEVRRSDG